MNYRLTLFFVIALTACGGPTEPPPGGGGGGDGGGGACAVTLSTNITVPTELVDSPGDCDYLLDGYVEISSTLVIDPGVVIVATQDSNLVVAGGQLLAVGTADKRMRIVLEGLNHVAGYWGGLTFNEGRDSRIEYVDLKDAGQECSSAFCPDAALILSDVTVSLTNTTVSNSYVNGVDIDSNTLLTNFAENRFYGNLGYGVLTLPSLIGDLDAASDYVGEGQPNGLPYVAVGLGEMKEDAT